MYSVLRHGLSCRANICPIQTTWMTEGKSMTKLEIYVSETCWACEEAKRIVADLAPQYPDFSIELRDVSDKRKPSNVFATPTYILNGRTIFLGNPTREELKNKLEAAR